MYEAEQQALEDSAVAKAGRDFDTFENDEAWARSKEDDQVDSQGKVIKEGRPIEDVKIEEWDEINKNLSSGLTKISSRSARASATARIAELRFDSEARTQDKINKIRIERGKNLSADTVVTLQQAGKFDLARDVIVRAAESGFYSPGERKAELKRNRNMQILNPYMLALGSGDLSKVEGARADVMGNLDIEDPLQRLSIYKSLLGEEDRLEADFQVDPRFEDNYLKALPLAMDGSLSLPSLIDERKNLTEKRFDGLVIIIKGRSSNSVNGGVTNSAGNAAMDKVMRELIVWRSRDPFSNYAEDIERAKLEIAMNPNISLNDVLQAQSRIDTISDQVMDNPDWLQLLDVERAAITGLTAGGFMSSGDKPVEARAYEEMELAFWRAARKDGPGFDANKWLDDNRVIYRSKTIQPKANKEGWKIIIVNGVFDIDATEKSIQDRGNALLNIIDTTTGATKTRDEVEQWYGDQLKTLSIATGTEY